MSIFLRQVGQNRFPLPILQIFNAHAPHVLACLQFHSMYLARSSSPSNASMHTTHSPESAPPLAMRDSTSGAPRDARDADGSSDGAVPASAAAAERFGIFGMRNPEPRAAVAPPEAFPRRSASASSSVVEAVAAAAAASHFARSFAHSSETRCRFASARLRRNASDAAEKLIAA